MAAGSDFSSQPPADHEPTRALLLAQALETCIQAERRVRGSAEYVIARQPAWARAELRRLIALASSLDAAAESAVMSEQFRAAARARLMRHTRREPVIAYPGAAGRTRHGVSGGPWLSAVPSVPSRNGHNVPSVASRNGHHVSRPGRRRSKWIWRGGLGGLLAAVLIGAATLTASANALPGEPLYSVKQAREELGVRFAPDDQARTLALLTSADARLDETARLLQQGRTEQVTQTTLEYDDAIARATTSYVVTIADPASGTVEDKLTQQQEELQSMLSSAPEPARSDLREALDAAERGRALVAKPQPIERHGSKPASVAAAPTPALEVEPTTAPVASVPPPVDLVAQPSPVVAATDDQEHQQGRLAAGSRQSSDESTSRHGSDDSASRQGGDDPAPSTTLTASIMPRGGPAINGRGAASGRSQDQRLDDVKLAPLPVVAEVDAAPQESQRNEADARQQPMSTDRVVAPAQSQDDGHDRIAEPAQPSSTSAQAAVAQRSSSDGGDGGRSSAPQAPAVAQSTSSGSGRASQPTPVVANQSTSDGDHHSGSDTSASTSSSASSRSTSSTQTSSASRTTPTSQTTSATSQSGGSRSSGSSTSTSSGDHDGSRTTSGGGH